VLSAPAHDPRRKKKERFDERKDSFDSEANQSEWQEQKPDNRIEYQCENCERPADDGK